jgi:pseudaminic acid cytidylyltransferase
MGDTDSLCLIPARGGSKRIPRKNIRPFLGEPILARVIKTALDSACFTEVMVSTDDVQIAEIAEKAGASVPFMRSCENSNDHAGTFEVIEEVLKRYESEGRHFETCCCLYATAVLTRSDQLREGKRLLESQPDLMAALPVLPFGYPIQRSVSIEGQRIRMFQPEHYASRSQDLEKAYHDAGQWYWLRPELLSPSKPLLGPESAPVVVSEMDAQDIDNESDWQLAEMKFQLRSTEKGSHSTP